MGKIELKPCPFCGAAVEIEPYGRPVRLNKKTNMVEEYGEPDGWQIVCKHHEWGGRKGGVDVAADVAMYSYDYDEANKALLIETWNTRHERITRCRDCKHCEEYGGFNDGHIEHWCNSPRFKSLDNEPVPVEPDGFCAWAEPKVGEA